MYRGGKVYDLPLILNILSCCVFPWGMRVGACLPVVLNIGPIYTFPVITMRVSLNVNGTMFPWFH